MSNTEGTKVLMKTSKGDIVIKLHDEKAPLTVENFLRYVDENYYENTIFHRVISNFMIQGGGFETGLNEKGTHKPIKNEADNGLSNARGTIAMARTMEVDSATSQFFINVKDNSFLNHGARDFGYCVFGEVVEGIDVVDAIKNVSTHTVGHYQNVPVEDAVILSIERVLND